MDTALLERAARAIAEADALFIGAGAGMGVDSGLPDFRGTKGFWTAYPPLAKLGLDFAAMANPLWFFRDPALAWGFYGHRRNLYRATLPHEGFRILRQWGQKMRQGAFVFTSNVDGHFQKAGFPLERIWEVHGSIEWLQCLRECGQKVFPAGPETVTVDETTMHAAEPFPACPKCGKLARPNILMFDDWHWDETHAYQQRTACDTWLRGISRPVVIECGAGLAIPTVRHFCEYVAGTHQGTLIRINVREPEVPEGQIGLPMGALAALQALDALLQRT
jgi:NAD-dependent SIR2 family protein deacetylase